MPIVYMFVRVVIWLSAFFLSISLFAQQPLKGRVVDEQTSEPLPFVTIFVNNTTFGTVTNEKGEFTLNLTSGRHEIVVSYVGYEPIVFQVDSSQLHRTFLFKLTLKEFVLNEIEVRSQRDSLWYVNLEVFKENFIGRSAVARGCKLLNPEVLIITFDPQSVLLEVKARDVLQIENPTLGYKIKYVLVEFKYYTQESYVVYVGYPNYEAMSGNSSRQRRWKKKRLEAYNGSPMHFIRTLREQKLEQEGFNLRRLHRKPNPNRPSEEELEQARAQLRQRGPQVVLKESDPISITLSKASLPKTIEWLDTARVSYQSYLQRQGKEVALGFEGYFQVVYTGEKEEIAYVQSTSGFQPRRPTFQTSVISMKEKSVFLEEMGNISDPLGILFEGYWGWEKIGDLLPLDYQVIRP
ncbi:carboxypeptidase-like regulatory domain-containing protein [Rhodocytophaga rosea]|uniref:Carboxypeptidase-like regulatory domain-containing protein n=1 Tax=Rhodocytophaga rosea TaxID=2704465 RepID=A0A6C0GER9_9BACT|nr:carboxypeptidase-like regulatory domain-containing protein [Rhodocytophaga rosea]QHT66475.1 carboxypeptidase-like regulatory domain-containing protein [Rhodocytophaga rosea]